MKRVAVALGLLVPVVALAIPALADTNLSAPQGSQAVAIVTVQSDEPATVSAEAEPSGVAVSFDPASGTEPTWTTQMTVDVGDIPPGDYSFFLVVTPDVGPEARETINLTVTPGASATSSTSSTTTEAPGATTTTEAAAETTSTTSTTTTTTSTTTTTTTPPTTEAPATSSTDDVSVAGVTLTQPPELPTEGADEPESEALGAPDATDSATYFFAAFLVLAGLALAVTAWVITTRRNQAHISHVNLGSRFEAVKGFGYEEDN